MNKKYRPDKPAWLYITTNIINGKMYIGQTTSSRTSYLGSGRLIQKAIKKYGRENFIREIIHHGTWEEIDLLESMYIEKYNCIESDKFYNLKEGGHHGKHANEKTSKKMSDARMGKSYEEIYGEEEATRQKNLRKEKFKSNGNPFFNKMHSIESRKKIKEARKTQIITKESNIKRSLTMTGMKREKVICPYCDKMGDVSLMKRYHFNNCKKFKS